MAHGTSEETSFVRAISYTPSAICSLACAIDYPLSALLLQAMVW